VPYYSDDLVTLYHGDCREWAGPVDAIVTDPPYGRDYLPLWSALGHIASAHLVPGGWLLAYSGQAVLPEVMATLGSDDLAYRWMLATVYPGGEQMARIGDMTVLTGWKPVVAYRRRPFGSGRGERGRFTDEGRTGFRDVLPRGGREKALHDWAQPMAEASELVARFTEPGTLVLDPFAGSGTVLAAAKALGRRAVGVEIDEAACRKAADRLGQEVLGLVV
jgi:site-specific DNA-methyltransferase (adenine-specific)